MPSHASASIIPAHTDGLPMVTSPSALIPPQALDRSAFVAERPSVDRGQLIAVEVDLPASSWIRVNLAPPRVSGSGDLHNGG